MDGNVTAPAEIAETFLPRVVYELEKRFPDLYDPHLVEMAADDALLNYLQHPQQYDPIQLPLDRYLIMSARGDLLNLFHKSQYPGFPKKTQFVELDAPAREYKTEVKDESLGVEEQAFILASPVWPLLEQLLPDVTDREIALLMLEGVRVTNEYALTLGISHLPKADQETEVKRHKDRIKKTLQRHIDRSELDATK
jgi:hypothetical protein